MGRKGSRYTIKEKLFYIGLVTQGMAPNAVQRKYGVEHSQVSRWLWITGDRWPAASTHGKVSK